MFNLLILTHISDTHFLVIGSGLVGVCVHRSVLFLVSIVCFIVTKFVHLLTVLSGHVADAHLCVVFTRLHTLADIAALTHFLQVLVQAIAEDYEFL